MDHGVLQIRAEEGGPRHIARHFRKLEIRQYSQKRRGKQIHDGGEEGCTSVSPDGSHRAIPFQTRKCRGLVEQVSILDTSAGVRIPAANADPVGIINC